MPTTNKTRTTIVTIISGSPTVGGVAKPVTSGVMGSPAVSGAEMVSSKTPGTGAV